MRGKNKCKILKQIRKQIAEENDIPLVTKECTYQGECSGTCPRCEAELRYLEQQLARRQALGKAVTVAALSVSLMTGAAGCSSVHELQGDVPYYDASPTEDTGVKNHEVNESYSADETGNYILPREEESAVELGEIVCDPTKEETMTLELEGDVAYIPDSVEPELAGILTSEDPLEFPDFGEISQGEPGNG